MATGCSVRKNEFYDSVFLMRVAKRIAEQPGVQQAAALMGTEKNRSLLADIQVSSPALDTATPNDLMVAVVADTEQTVRDILDQLDQWMRRDRDSGKESAPRTLDAALARQPDANLAVISVSGQYAAREARHALERGLNVFVFSSNVSVDDELALKEYARERGLVVMGPDCGTSIIGGLGIGFANVVRRGPVGVIGASGTGIQEFTTLVHRWGSGISHAIGTGSRDLSDAIGGLSALSALDALERDRATKVIAIVSKPPGAKTLAVLIERISSCDKPVVTCFLGVRDELPGANVRFRIARTLDDAARIAVQIATGKSPISNFQLPTPNFQPPTSNLQLPISNLQSPISNLHFAPERKYIRGIFAGGTFCYQAQQVLQDLGIRVYSNAPLPGNMRLSDPRRSIEHTLVDMGDEFFTDGRAHPMIDASLRRDRIVSEANDPRVAVLLLDFILGYNASADPVGDLIEAVTLAQSRARARGGTLAIIASVCGTDGDPQGLQRQQRQLQDAGVIVLPSSAEAARECGRLVLAQG
ncbi:MAG: acyl-CoA synthetase FdrA [Chloroflexi bacterium]|nr:acyl-CoA synthetase FdrA [Chloroflexota bacterium]